jgi:hypothetical protein
LRLFLRPDMAGNITGEEEQRRVWVAKSIRKIIFLI